MESTSTTKKPKNMWQTSNDPYIGKEIRRTIPAQFLPATTKTPQFITGKITCKLPRSKMHPRQPTLYHVEYFLPTFPNEDITLEEVEKGLSLTNKRIPLNAISPEERSKEEDKIKYYQDTKESMEKDDSLSFMKDVLLARICETVLTNLEENVKRERELRQEKDVKKVMEKKEMVYCMGLPEYYHSYPKKKVVNTEEKKLPPTWFSLFQIHANIKSSLEEIYTTTSKKVVVPAVATRRSIRKAVQAIEEQDEEEESGPTNHIQILLSEHPHIIQYCAKEKYLPTYLDLLSTYRSTILTTDIKPTVRHDAPILCKQPELLNRKMIKDEEAFSKTVQFRKKKVVKQEMEEKKIALEEERLIWEYNIWRYNCIHFGYTKWSNAPSLPIELQNTAMVIAGIEDEEPTTLARRTKKSIFYGGSSGKYISQSQIMDTVTRLVCKSTNDGMTYSTLEAVVCGTEEAVASENVASTRKKIPMAFWKLLYYQGKIRRYPVQLSQDKICYRYEKKQELEVYIEKLQGVERTIRKLVLESLAFDICDIACAADNGIVPEEEERVGEDVDWETPEMYKDQMILRPKKDSKVLSLWKVNEYLPSITVQNDVTRRKWYKVVSEDEKESMIITENQLCAGKEAYDLSLVYPNNPMNASITTRTKNQEQKQESSSWILQEGITIINNEETNEIEFATIVGYHPIPDTNDLRVLILYDDKDVSTWMTLNLNEMTLSEKKIYFHNPNYSKNPQALLLSKLKSHAKIAPFLDPVDPIELDLPDYFDVVKHPMDITTVETACLKFEYGKDCDVNNADFQHDLGLIFDNAILYNPTSSWISRDAKVLKRFVEKETSLISAGVTEEKSSVKNPYSKRYASSASTDKKSKYYVPDSDTSDSAFSDTDYKSSRKKRKKKQKKDEYEATPEATNMTSITSNVIERYRPIPSYTNLSFLNKLDINTTESSFILWDEEWSCKYQRKSNDDVEHALWDEEWSCKYQQKSTDDDEHADMEYHHKVIEQQLALIKDKSKAMNREQIESIFEKLHEEYHSKLFYDFYTNAEEEEQPQDEDTENGKYHDNIFPPYLGQINPNTQTWEIRTSHLIPAIQYIIRGLENSKHISYDKLLPENNQLSGGSIIPNHLYYYNPTTEPFDIISTAAKKKEESEEESSEDEAELNEYERLRRERVARNQERLKALGLT